ncbi:MAG: hypothetical protein ACR2NM_13440 [Bythopirellula sp.]
MDSQPNNDNQNPQIDSNNSLLDEAEALIWALLDDQIESADIKKLEGLLQENEAVRQRYISCVQMHCDLHEHFGGAKTTFADGKLPDSPVLGSLGDIRPGTDTWPPVAE